MFPAFIDLAEAHPDLRNFDETTQQVASPRDVGETWPGCSGTRAGPRCLHPEAAALPALIGKLHEDEIRSWLWTEDQVVLVDLLGSDVPRSSPRTRSDLVLSGIERDSLKVMGRLLDEQAYYGWPPPMCCSTGSGIRRLRGGRRIARRFTSEGWRPATGQGRRADRPPGPGPGRTPAVRPWARARNTSTRGPARARIRNTRVSSPSTSTGHPLGLAQPMSTTMTATARCRRAASPPAIPGSPG